MQVERKGRGGRGGRDAGSHGEIGREEGGRERGEGVREDGSPPRRYTFTLPRMGYANSQAPGRGSQRGREREGGTGGGR